MGEVLIRDFPTPVGQWKVSPQGGLRPRWSRDGRHIYYWKLANLNPGNSASFESTDTLFRVQVDRSPSVVVRAPEFVAALRTGRAFVWWDLHPDGRTFIVAIPNSDGSESSGGAPETSRHVVILNWFAELNELVSKRP